MFMYVYICTVYIYLYIYIYMSKASRLHFRSLTRLHCESGLIWIVWHPQNRSRMPHNGPGSALGIRQGWEYAGARE